MILKRSLNYERSESLKMPKYKVELQAIVTATVWVECSDENEAQSIAKTAWRPTLNGAGIDPTIHAIYDYDVPTHAGNAYCFGDVEQVE